MTSHFTVDLPGQPASWNRTYRIVRLPAKDKFGQPVFRPDGTPKKYSTMKKTAAVAEYQQVAKLILDTAKPSDFFPEGYIYVLYEFFLARDIDCDNAMKAIDDVLAVSLSINDKMFLPVTLGKTLGHKEPFVRLTILDEDHWKITAQPR